MQAELLNTRKWKARVELSTAIFDWIEVFYNRGPTRSACGIDGVSCAAADDAGQPPSGGEQHRQRSGDHVSEALDRPFEREPDWPRL